MSLFRSGDFTLHSGKRSAFKIDVDALTDAEIGTLAVALIERLPSFGQVEGVPTGGLRLADALLPFVTDGPLLIVDDVLTTGGSMEAHRKGRRAMGAVLFAKGDVPAWIYPLFTMNGRWLMGIF